MNNYRESIIKIARQAGIFLRNKLYDEHTIDYKGEIDIVTEADIMSEEMIISQIHQYFPQHNIIAEESVETNNDSEFRWIIDPLDGTTNYAHGYPVFCVSIAMEKAGKVLLGVIYNPMLDEMFVAEKGRGAYLNNNNISVSKTRDLSKSMLATGFPYDIRHSKDNNINNFRIMAENAQAIRRAGSAALDMAYVAAGRFDGFWELKLKPWDTAAGALLVEEAGGTVTDLSGGKFYLDSPNILASNSLIHRDMISLFSKT